MPDLGGFLTGIKLPPGAAIIAAGGRSLGNGEYEEVGRGPVTFGWHQLREGDRWRVRHEENGRLCPEPNNWPLEGYGDALRRSLDLNREQTAARLAAHHDTKETK